MDPSAEWELPETQDQSDREDDHAPAERIGRRPGSLPPQDPQYERAEQTHYGGEQRY